MSEFNLESWEIGPRCRERLKGWADGEVAGDIYRVVKMRHRKWVVFTRTLHGPDRGNWIVGSLEENAPRIWGNVPDRSQSVRIVPGVGRFFAWGEEMVFLSANGAGAWLNAALEAQTPFASEAPASLIERDSHETYAHLTRELDGDSDFAFARRWPGLDNEAKLAALYGGTAHLEELRALVRSILVLNAVLQPEHKNYIWQLFLHKDLLFEQGQRYYWLPPFLQSWRELIVNSMMEYSSHPMRDHPCIAQFAVGQESALEVEMNSAPTQHEHLEARLFLREWLQDKVGLDQREKLLGDAN